MQKILHSVQNVVPPYGKSNKLLIFLLYSVVQSIRILRQLKVKAKNVHSSLLVIFDFDGVLANSKDAYAAQMKETIETISDRSLSLEILSSRVGNTDQRDDFRYFLQTENEEDIALAVKTYEVLTPKYEHLRTLYPGIRNLVETLFDSHYTGIVSRKPQKRMEYWSRILL